MQAIERNIDNIPSELRVLSHWVNWRMEIKEGKPTKIPLNPRTLKNAMSNNSDTWGTFEAAVSNWSDEVGVGFVVTSDDPFTGIDLDKCRDPQKGNIESWALEIIQRIKSYSEVSPSGTGIRMFARCKLPEGTARKVGKVEAYDCNHFLTLTGNVLDGITEIRTVDGNDLHRFLMQVGKDQQIVDKTKSTKSGEKFQALWNGDWSGYSSQSEADMALTSILYFHTKDREWTDRLFRKSGLMRSKWDEKHFADGRTYGQKLIEEVSRGDNNKSSTEDTVTSDWPEPIPFDDYSLLPIFPLEALPKIGHEMVDAVARCNQVDIGLAAINYLAVVSASVANKTKVNLKTHIEPLNLYVNGILDSGERKSTTQNMIVGPLYDYQQQRCEELSETIREELSKHKIREVRLARIQKQAATSEDINERKKYEREAIDLSNEIAENPVPVLPTHIADDITPEKAAILMEENKNTLAIFSTEGGIFEILGGRYSDSVNIDLFLKAHSCDPYVSHRVGRPSVILKEPCLTLCLMVQPDVISEVGKNKQFRGRGLTARILYVRGKPHAGYRTRHSISMNENLVRAYKEHVFKLLKIEPSPYLLILSDEAQRIWDEFYLEAEADMRPTGSLEFFKDWGSKLPGQVARIAGLLHFATYEGEAMQRPISITTMSGACAVGCYFKAHALAAFGIMREDARIESAKRILEYIISHRKETLKGRDVLMSKNYFKTMDEVSIGLKVLIERSFVKEQEKQQYPGIGRPEATIYLVNPKIKTLWKHQQ